MEEVKGEEEEGEICAKMEQLLQVTFMNEPEGDSSSLILSLSLCPYAIVIDPYYTKRLFRSNSKDLSRSKSLSVLCVHTLPSHYVSPFTKLIEQWCNGLSQTFVASTPKNFLWQSRQFVWVSLDMQGEDK